MAMHGNNLFVTGRIFVSAIEKCIKYTPRCFPQNVLQLGVVCWSFLPWILQCIFLSILFSFFCIVILPVRTSARIHFILRQWSKYSVNKSVYQRVALIRVQQLLKCADASGGRACAQFQSAAFFILPRKTPASSHAKTQNSTKTKRRREKKRSQHCKYIEISTNKKHLPSSS